MKTKLAAFAATGVLALTMTAQAVQIDGSIAFSGTPLLVGGSTFTAASSIDFTEVEVNAGEALGDYLPTDGYQFGAGDSFGPIDINPVVLPFTLWSFEVGGVTYTFEAQTLTGSLVTPRAIQILGEGVARVDGFEDTPGTWIFQANQSGGSFSFASSAEVTPEVPDGGITMMLFGGTLSAFAVVRRRLL
jgi:type 1 fimbria pilin